MPSAQFTRFMVTFNGLDEATFDPTEPVLPAHPNERYAAWQLECGEENGNLHVQAYVEVTKKVTVVGLARWYKDQCGVQPHVDAANGTPEECRAYVTKDDTRMEGPWTRGEFGRSGRGARNDLRDACEALKVGGIKRVAQEFPEAFVKYPRGFRELERVLDERPRDEDFVPRPWQQRVLDRLKEPANDRNIVWVTDTAGNNGKSRLARHLVCEHNAIIMQGKIADMGFAYNKEPIVIFDITRAQADCTKHLYSFAEQLKNGVLFSSKYESGQKVFKPPHVMFFSNTSYDPENWTSDRVIELDLNNPNFTAAPLPPAEDPFVLGFA